MKLYKVVIGYIQLKFTKSGEMVAGGQQFPISPFNIIADSPEIAEYLVSDMEVEEYELIEPTEAPTYLTHELN